MSTLEEFARGLMRPIPDETPSEWCERNIYIPPPQTQTEGWFRLTGREYCREFIDDFGDGKITDEVACFGSQTAKTTSLMAGVAWCLAEDPCGILWVMPNLDLARSFSETRWMPLLRASPTLAQMIPTGAKRWDFKKCQQQVGASIVNFIGSNSPANLASRPARRVILDEVDKFYEGGRGEADAVNLAEQRTKSFSNPQRFKTSTPTLSDGLIWQEFMKGDQRRYFMPCVHCGKHVIFAWSVHFTVFKLTGCEAYVKWDKEAKGEDGNWDLDRVYRSAHAECPHCGGHINDGHKTRMVREGEWRPTVQAASTFRSRHLPSLYASSPETGFGRLAVKFLQAKRSLMGLQGFINGDLAEPWEGQDARAERVEIITGPEASELTGSKKILTVDCQRTAPYFWYVVREWNGDSRLMDCGSLDEWEQVYAKQLEHGIPNHLVGIDSGDQTERVYVECIAHSAPGRAIDDDGRRRLLWVGWRPCKGFPKRDQWKNQKTGRTLPYHLGDAAVQSQACLKLLEFSTNHIKDMLSRLRTKQTRFRWEVVKEKATEVYWKHMDSEIKKPFHNPRTNRTTYEWVQISNRWPNHLFDCEAMQVAMALLHGLLPWTETHESK